MGLPAAKLGDRIVGVDVHTVMVPTLVGEVPAPVASPFDGEIMGGVCATVLIQGRPAATAGSTAINRVPHVPAGGRFMAPPTNTGRIIGGSATVLIGGRPAARLGDPATSCADTGEAPTSSVMVAGGTVLIG